MLGNIAKLKTVDDFSLCSFLQSSGLKYITQDDLQRHISKQFHNDGIVFSPGEEQKISDVRTLLADRAIVVFDELSSSMDVLTEDMIVNTIFTLSSLKMIIFVSHRPSNMKKVDKILFMERGKLVESGSHKELIKLNGKYAELFEKQSKNFI